MKNLIFSILTFAFVFSYCVGANSQTITQKKSSDAAEPLKVKFCDVINQPKDFEGKLIRMSITYREVFAENVLLLSSSCKDKFIEPAFDEESKKATKKIEEKLQFSEDELVRDADVTVVGILTKNKYDGYRPIKNLLQGYRFVIKEVK